MKRLVATVIFAGVLILGGFAFAGGVGLDDFNLNYTGWSDDYAVYETHMLYPSIEAEGLDYVIENNGDEYLWAVMIGVNAMYSISYPNLGQSPLGENEDWWGWDQWNSMVLASDNLPEVMANMFVEGLELNGVDYEAIYNFIAGNVSPIFSDYGYVYIAAQGYGDNAALHPIAPGDSAVGFGVIDYGPVGPWSPVVYVSTDDPDPANATNWNFTRNESIESVVPEPSGYLLVLMGVFFVFFIRRRQLC